MQRRLGAWCLLALTAQAQPMRWERLAALPESLGVAAPFAGVHGGALVVAGGANFPEGPPWEGGKKVWHDRVWILEKPDGAWRDGGRLPHPLAYGVSVSTADGVVCVGGSDAHGHHAGVFRLRWDGQALHTDPLPALPMPLANACGALIGTTIHIGTGSEKPGEEAATNRSFAMDLAAHPPVWRELPPLPGPPRLLATAAVHQGRWFVIGGAALEPGSSGTPKRHYLSDVWSYEETHGWRRRADVPHPVAAAPSPAAIVGDSVLLLPGDDGSKVGFSQPARHPGFPRGVLAYHPAEDRWTAAGDSPAPRVTTPCVPWSGRFVIPSGEVRPGVRSPEIWTFFPP